MIHNFPIVIINIIFHQIVNNTNLKPTKSQTRSNINKPDSMSQDNTKKQSEAYHPIQNIQQTQSQQPTNNASQNMPNTMPQQIHPMHGQMPQGIPPGMMQMSGNPQNQNMNMPFMGQMVMMMPQMGMRPPFMMQTPMHPQNYPPQQQTAQNNPKQSNINKPPDVTNQNTQQTLDSDNPPVSSKTNEKLKEEGKHDKNAENMGGPDQSLEYKSQVDMNLPQHSIPNDPAISQIQQKPESSKEKETTKESENFIRKHEPNMMKEGGSDLSYTRGAKGTPPDQTKIEPNSNNQQEGGKGTSEGDGNTQPDKNTEKEGDKKSKSQDGEESKKPTQSPLPQPKKIEEEVPIELIIESDLSLRKKLHALEDSEK